jgi:hypothetical protein
MTKRGDNEAGKHPVLRPGGSHPYSTDAEIMPRLPHADPQFRLPKTCRISP